MAYVKHSTNNPHGKRPWQFAVSTNGLSRYDAEKFVIPTVTTGNPLTDPVWQPSGLGRYTRQDFPVPMAGLLSRGRLGEYTAQSFEIPTSTVLVNNAPPPWAGSMSGLGDYEVDPATLPPPPAGMQYNSAYQLVPIPKPDNTPVIVAGLLAAGAAAYWYFKGGGKKYFAPPKMKLPVVPFVPGARA